MTGPNPEKIIGRFRRKIDVKDRVLEALKKLSPSQREHLTERILNVWAQYQSQLSVLRQSPTRAEILAAVTERHEQIGTMVRLLSDPLPRLKAKPAAGEAGERTYQFHSALGDLFEHRGHSLHGFKVAAEDALEAVRRFDMVASELHSIVELSQDDGLFIAQSEKAFRDRLFRSLYKVLREGGVNDGLGVNATITVLVMELEENPRMGGDDEAEYRKGLARQIKAAVKDLEANEFGAPPL